jgi:hypothetical protein
MFKNKYIQFLLMFSPLLFCGFCLYLDTYLKSVPFGFFGGDCVEGPGSVTISGTVMDMNNQPVQDVQLRATKADGGCPQSIPVDEVVLSDENGNFITVIYFTVADPEAQIEISADGYTPCHFTYDPTSRRALITLQLTITLSETMQVEGNLINNEGRLIRDIEPCS